MEDNPLPSDFLIAASSGFPEISLREFEQRKKLPVNSKEAAKNALINALSVARDCFEKEKTVETVSFVSGVFELALYWLFDDLRSRYGVEESEPSKSRGQNPLKKAALYFELAGKFDRESFNRATGQTNVNIARI